MRNNVKWDVRIGTKKKKEKGRIYEGHGTSEENMEKKKRNKVNRRQNREGQRGDQEDDATRGETTKIQGGGRRQGKHSNKRRRRDTIR